MKGTMKSQISEIRLINHPPAIDSRVVITVQYVSNSNIVNVTYVRIYIDFIESHRYNKP